MGCDGGTIPRRDELVRTKKKPEQKDKNSELSFRWQHCTISQQPLQTPIVACGLGRIYSKHVVLESLLDRSTLPQMAHHIKNLKDIRDLKLTPNPAFKASIEKGDTNVEWQTVPYICPVIGLEMNGKFRFVFLWNCGCVVSERALKEVKSSVCHKCQQPFVEEDIVILNGTDEDVDLMKTRMATRQARLKAEKKAKHNEKRSAKVSATVTSGESSNSSTSTDEDPLRNSSVELKSDSLTSTVKLPPVVGASTSAAIEVLNGTKIKASQSTGTKPLKRPTSSSLGDPLFKKTKEMYSIAKDPKATDVFKSLFTTHRTAHEQTKAHWVTYNPFYN